MLPHFEALQEFEAIDPVRARVVKLHYFSGFTLSETADTLGVSLATVNGNGFLHDRGYLGKSGAVDPEKQVRMLFLTLWRPGLRIVGVGSCWWVSAGVLSTDARTLASVGGRDHRAGVLSPGNGRGYEVEVCKLGGLVAC